MKIKEWLQSLSFRTGVIVLMCCIPFYILSFAQMLVPSVQQQKACFGLCSSDWPRPASMEV